MNPLKRRSQMVDEVVDEINGVGLSYSQQKKFIRFLIDRTTKGDLMKHRLLSMADVARESMVPRYRISYALEIGVLKEPPRVGSRRCFSSKDLEAIRSYFRKESKNERQ